MKARTHLEGVPVAEVAEDLGCSKQNIYQAEARALLKIRKGLAARGFGEAITDMPAWLASYLFEFLDS